MKYEGRFFDVVVVLESSAGVARPRIDDGTRVEANVLETLRSRGAFRQLNLVAVEAILYCAQREVVCGFVGLKENEEVVRSE